MILVTDYTLTSQDKVENLLICLVMLFLALKAKKKKKIADRNKCQGLVAYIVFLY